MKRATIKDVAKEAGVSSATVSHVINGTRYVDIHTKERVLATLDILDYHPNNIARSLKSGKTKTIGLIVPDASNMFFAEIARKIEDKGFQKGYSVILGNSDNNPSKQANYINTLIAKQIDGMIFISTGGEEKDLRVFFNNRIPVVVADRDVPLELADVVLIDNKNGGYEATKYLIELGHSCIGCITGPNDLSPSMQRVEGYIAALKEFGLPYNKNLVKTGDFTIKGGEEALKQLVNNNCHLTAVFAFNDMMAIGAMSALRKIGYQLPLDFSIMGFDDIELASAVTPSLTTISQPIEEIANCATELLIDRIIGNRHEENRRIILSTKLVVRESTKTLRISK